MPAEDGWLRMAGTGGGAPRLPSYTVAGVRVVRGSLGPPPSIASREPGPAPSARGAGLRHAPPQERAIACSTGALHGVPGGRESPHRRVAPPSWMAHATEDPVQALCVHQSLAEAATKDADGMKIRALTLRLRAGGCARAPAGTLSRVRHVSRRDVGGQSLFLGGQGSWPTAQRVVQKKSTAKQRDLDLR